MADSSRTHIHQQKQSTKIHTHIRLFAHMQAQVHRTIHTTLELNRWCLVWGLYSTSKGHLWHLRSHTNDDAQRSFATTKAEQKNWHEREVNKHKSFNKTFFFFFCWIHYKGFHCFSSHTTQQKEKARSVESHDWLRSVATFLSQFPLGWVCPGYSAGTWGQVKATLSCQFKDTCTYVRAKDLCG